MSDNVGGSKTQGRLFSNTELSGLVSAFDFERHWSRVDGDGIAYFETKGFERLVKAITKGSVSLETAILRRWRVRP